MIRWFAGPFRWRTCQPNIWCSRFSFHKILQNSLQKPLNLSFYFFYKITNIYKKLWKKNTWNVRRLVNKLFAPSSQQTSVLYCRVVTELSRSCLGVVVKLLRSCCGVVVELLNSCHWVVVEFVSELSGSCHRVVVELSRSCHGFVAELLLSFGGVVTDLLLSDRWFVVELSQSCQANILPCDIVDGPCGCTTAWIGHCRY